jgi:hypothetical protein
MFRRMVDLDWETGWLRVEEFVDDGTLVVPAELPDLDPDKDVELSVSNGVLTGPSRVGARVAAQLRGPRRAGRARCDHRPWRSGGRDESMVWRSCSWRLSCSSAPSTDLQR